MKYNKQSKLGLNVKIITPNNISKDKTDELPFKLNFKVYEFYYSHQTVDYKIGIVESLSEINDTISKIKNNSTVDYIDNISQSKQHEDNIKKLNNMLDSCETDNATRCFIKDMIVKISLIV